MSRISFLECLQVRPWILADGAIGTNLFEMGLASGDSPEIWNVDFPERVAELHRHFIRAGSELILTNSFGGNSHRLKLHDAEKRVSELNYAAARLASTEAEKADHPVIVAGSMGPSGEIFEPVGTLSHAGGVKAFTEQAFALAEGGVDVLWIETLASEAEIKASVEGASKTGLPIVVTLSFDSNGQTMMGITPERFATLLQELPVPLAAWGANCGSGVSDLVVTISELAQHKTTTPPLVAKGNCGVPHYHEGQIHYTGTPDVMGKYARQALDAGAKIIGGCCGTNPAHIEAMRQSLSRIGSHGKM